MIVAARALNWRRCAVITATGLLPQYLLLFASKSPSTFWLLAAGFLLAGLVTAAGGIIWDAEYQSQLPGQYLSRLGSLENFVNTAAVPVGMLLGGLTEGHDRVIFVPLGAVVLVFSLVCSRMARRHRVAPQGSDPVAHRSEEYVRNAAGHRDGVWACGDQEGTD